METVVSLFPSQAEAQVALDALENSEFADARLEVLGAEAERDDEGSKRIAAAPHNVDLYEGLGERERTYFTGQLIRGNVLVVAVVEEERVEPLKAFFHEHGGQTEMGK